LLRQNDLFLKKQLYDSSWVGPKRSGHADYLLSAAFNVIVIIALISFSFFISQFSSLMDLILLLARQFPDPVSKSFVFHQVPYRPVK
jgi:hypothetical protein